MQFVDLTKVYIRSGSGGNGSISFRREKSIEYGGPDGGDGGHGGSIYAQPVKSLNTLIDHRYQRHIFAGNGQQGRGKQRSGSKGQDKIIYVPVGTEILNEDQTVVLHDLVDIHEKVLLASGGNGGFGNHHFRSANNRAPRHANPGQSGLERTLWLRLKILADVGLVGLPNAGKSTFLASVTNAKPKISDYPFTTLYPNLGIVRINHFEFVIADIPGLIEGAHEGKGIGGRFLGHVERCKFLLHIIDLSQQDVVGNYRVIIQELEHYGLKVGDKPSIVVATKSDLIDNEECDQKLIELSKIHKGKVFGVSALVGTGIAILLNKLATYLDDTRREEQLTSTTSRAEWTP